MSTYSVYDIKIDNKLTFTPGPTAGYVLSINEDGSTSWVEAQGGGGGGFDIDTNVLYRFTRLTDTGNLDLKLVNQVFNTSLVTNVTGTLVTTKNGFNNTVLSMKIDSNGKIYLGGNFTSYNNVNANRIIRLNPDGTVDTGFVYGSGFTSTVEFIEIDADGKIYVGGQFTSYNGVGVNRIIRLNPDGTRDDAFVYGSGFNQTVEFIKIDVNGKIYVGGAFTSYNGVGANRIIRLNPDGTVDTGFVYGTGFSSTVISIEIDDNGKIYCGGFFASFSGSATYNGTVANRIIRLNPDGTVDTDFNFGTGFSQTVESIKIDSNGKIYVVGQFTLYNGVGATRIIRLNPDGTVDTGFVSGSGFSSTVLSIKIDDNDKIYCGGAFNTYNGVGSVGIIRLNPDGTRDDAFVYGTGFNGGVARIEIDANGKICFAGFFQGYNGL
jgi:uncharacterized delta-60 repeat protein